MHTHLREPLIGSLIESSAKRLHDLKAAHFELLDSLKLELDETQEAYEKAIKEYEEKDEDSSEDPEEIERIHAMENIIERNRHRIDDLEQIDPDVEFCGLSDKFVEHLSEIAWTDHCGTVDLRNVTFDYPIQNCCLSCAKPFKSIR